MLFQLFFSTYSHDNIRICANLKQIHCSQKVKRMLSGQRMLMKRLQTLKLNAKLLQRKQKIKNT